MGTNTLKEQFYALGIRPGDVILVHSSMKSLGIDLTPEEFLLELMDFLTEEGTLLLPGLTYEGVNSEQPVFYSVSSEPCVGILPRTFLQMRGVERSLHPTHSVCAWGRRAKELTSRHILDNTPVGPNSPFMLLPEVDGKLLFIGDILHSCTFMHGVEEIVNAPYAIGDGQVSFTVIDNEGSSHEKLYYVHDFDGWEQEYTRIRDILSYPDIRTGIVGQASCTLIDAKKLKNAAIERFNENIYAFVSKKTCC